jgi:hypothetical protein
MRSFAGLATAFAIGFSTIAATAMPIDIELGKGQTQVTRVADGCGAERHRGPGGHCRPRYSCPSGWHSGPHGWHCYRN